MKALEMGLYFTIGGVLGALYLGGLWLTVTWVTRLERPLWLLPVSTLVRGGLLVGAFALVTGLQWDRLLACVAGFAVARFIVTALARAEPARRDSLS